MCHASLPSLTNYQPLAMLYLDTLEIIKYSIRVLKSLDHLSFLALKHFVCYFFIINSVRF